MPDPITWATLSKAVLDSTTIEQQIDADILAHNQDPSAHGQAGEVVEAHRSDTELDHPSESVDNDKILKLARAYRYIVDPAGNGDYTTIAAALTQVIADGGGSIFIKNGTYTPTADLVVPPDCVLVGESMEGVIIDFNSGNFQVLVEGSANTTPAGTISVASNDATVTGAGTNFDPEVSAGDFIRVNDVWHEVLSVTDDTHLELVQAYQGDAQAGLAYDVLTPKSNITLENFSVRESGDGYGLFTRYLKNCFFRRIQALSGSVSGIRFSWLFDCSVEDVYAIGNAQFGIIIDECQSTHFIGISALSNGWWGCQIQGDETSGIFVLNSSASHNGWGGFKIISGDRASYIGCEALANNGDGFNLTVVDYPNLIACYSEKNDGHGINFDNNVDYAKLLSNTCLNNTGWGINMPGGASNNNKEMVGFNVCLGNTLGQINDATGDSETAHNIVA